MRGGHNKKTTKQHIADGTLQPVRHANRLELPAVSEIPPPPADFDKDHKAKWVEVCTLLHQAEILTKADNDVIRLYVETTLKARQLFKEVRQEGDIIDGKRNPKWITYVECVTIQKQLFAEFGYTPRARMSLKVQPQEKKPEDPAAKFN